MCFLAFPRCDDTSESLLLCQSACVNMMRACKYPKDMWRCFVPGYYGGKQPEGADGDQILDLTGNPVYKRAPFPGGPFRENMFDDDDEPVTVCTPSLADGAADAASKTGFLALAGVVMVAVFGAARVGGGEGGAA